MDEVVVKSFMEPGHIVLFAVIMGMVLGIMSVLWKVYFPKALAHSLSNGAGKQIGDIVEARVTKANEGQSAKFEAALRRQEERSDTKLSEAVALNDQKLKDAFAAHEEVESLRLRLVVKEAKDEEHTAVMACASEVFGKLDAQERRLDGVEKELVKLQG